jgi:hypothetical protein
MFAMKLSPNRLRWVAAAIGLLALGAGVQAKDKKVKAPPPDPQDEIVVVGHVPLTDGAVKRFVATQHYSKYYLYVEHDAGKNVTLIDVTKPERPSVLADVAYPSNGDSGSLFAVAGTAALVAGGPAAQTASTAPPQTFRIMDFSDPLHPKIAREFAGVTAINRDDRRGLIFIANAEGLWILGQHLAEDPEVEKEFEHHVIYDH